MSVRGEEGYEAEGCNAPGGLERSRMPLADVVLAVCVGVEVHLARRGGGDEERRSGEEGGGELHLDVALNLELEVS